MRKLIGFVACLLLGQAAMIGGTFTNIGSASEMCLWGGGIPVPPSLLSIHATGTSINLTCPDPWFGDNVMGSIGPLMTQASVGGGSANPPDIAPTFSLQSTFMDSLLPVGGTGQGTVQFTLTYSRDSFGDSGIGTMSGDFIFNGNQIWSRSDQTCLFGEPCFSPCCGPVIVTTIVDLPVVYGIPFFYQGDVSSASGCCVFYSVQNSLNISATILTGGQVVELPEPASLCLCGIGSLGLLLRRASA